MASVCLVCQEYNRKFVLSHMTFPLSRMTARMNEPGGGSTGYNVMQPLGTDHFFSDPKSMQIFLN